MLHILNCITDDKFIDGLIEVLDASGDNVYHDFIFISDAIDIKFTYIKKAKRIKIIDSNDFLPFLIKEKYDAVVLHNFSSLPTHLVVNVPKDILVFWFAWGFDIYTMPVYKPLVKIRNLYHPLTKKYIHGDFFDKIRHRHAIIDSFLKRKSLHKAMDRVDYFSGVLPVEYDLMRKNKYFKAEKVEFNYFRLDSHIREDNFNDSFAQNNNILIGNSGDFTNNHLDVFESLHLLDLKDNKIYSFLSYGGTREYKDKVKEIGLLYFGNNFIPIEEYLPYDKFSDIILSCGNVIMGHERQQAMGNIYMALWNGCKLFLSETSVAYNCLKKRGYKLFTIQNDLNELTINREMPLHDKMENRKLLVKYNSPKVFMEKIHKIYDLIEKSQAESQL